MGEAVIDRLMAIKDEIRVPMRGLVEIFDSIPDDSVRRMYVVLCCYFS